MIWCIKTYTIAHIKIQKNEEKLSIMSNLQPNCCLKVDFQKVDQHAGGKWLIQDTKRHKDNDLFLRMWLLFTKILLYPLIFCQYVTRYYINIEFKNRFYNSG